MFSAERSEAYPTKTRGRVGDLGHFEAAGISKLRFFERGLRKNGKVYGKNGGILGTAQLRSKNFRKTIFADFQVWRQKNPKM